jgi:hypothetical protein
LSDFLLVPSVFISVVFVALLVGAVEPHPGNAADVLQAEGRLGPAQAALVRAGVSVDDAMSIPEECAARCTFDLGREFPLLCDCPPEVP